MPDAVAAEAPPKPQPTVAYSRLMWASVVCMIMFGAVLAVPPVCLDALGRELGINYEERGFLITVRMAALIASLLVVGYIGEGSRKRHFLFWGLAAIGLSQMMGARAAGYTSLLGAMVVSGLGKGVVEALVNPLVAQLNPARSARALNIINGLFSVGLVVGALSAGELLEAGHSWRLPFWLWVLPPMISAMLYMTPRYPAPSAPVTAAGLSEGRVRRFLRTPLFWVLCLAMVMGGGCEAGLTSWAPNFTADVLGASARGGAWTTAFYGAAMALGRFASGALLARFTPVRLMVISAVACGVATLALTFVQGIVGAYVLFALGGLFVACFWPTLLSVASDHISTGSTSLFSLLAAAGVSGCVLFPWAIGALGDLLGLRVAVLVLPTSMALLLVMLGFVWRLTRDRSHL
jgi:fucose permease